MTNEQDMSVEQRVDSLQQQLNQSGEEKEQMFSWLVNEICDAVNGILTGPLSERAVKVSSVTTDSRTVEPSSLYIAIKGENFDGHQFVKQAVQQGATAVMVSEDVEVSVPAIVVDDTRLALGEFARWHRRNMPVKTLVAVTGSNGKTTVKTLLSEMFSLVGNTWATQGNLNNDFGVPRTLLALRPEHEFAVIEMGANHIGEIEYLTGLAEPDIALLNNASDAHIEGFGSLQGVIQAKGEIFMGLNRFHSGGRAVINTDSPGFEQWQERISGLGIEQVSTFGSSPAALVRLQQVENSESGLKFTLNLGGEAQQVTMPVLGEHNALNAAACVAVGLSAGLSWSQIKPALQQFSGVAGRLQRQAIDTHFGHGWLIDDSYNANPGSVRAAIDTLATMPSPGVLCLGAMAELGEQTETAHAEIAQYALSKGVKHLYVYGLATQNMPEHFGEGAKYFTDHASLAQQVYNDLAYGEIGHVLVKGSRSAGMEAVVTALSHQLQQDPINTITRKGLQTNHSEG